VWQYQRQLFGRLMGKKARQGNWKFFVQICVKESVEDISRNDAKHAKFGEIKEIIFLCALGVLARKILLKSLC